MVKVAIVGCGTIGPTHIDAYKQLKDVEIAAVCDLDENRAKAAQERSGASYITTDYHDILKRPDIDIISVCIPTYQHAELTIKAAQAGKHVFCEKPMAMRIEDAKAMIAACEQADVKLGLGFCRRFDNQWLKMAEIVHSGILGDQIIWRSYATSRGAPTPWFFDREFGGGPFVDGAVHNYDFAELMFGQISQVSANLKTLRSGITAKDTGTAILDYKNGNQLTMAWSWALPQGARGAGSQELFGSKGALCFSNPAPDVIKVPEGTHALYVSTGPNAGQAFPFERNHMYVDELRHFVDCVKSGDTPKVGGQNGVNALRVALAVLEAGDTGRTISLD